MQPVLKQKDDILKDHRTAQNIQHWEGEKGQTDWHHCQQLRWPFLFFSLMGVGIQIGSRISQLLHPANSKQHVRPNHKMAGEFFHPSPSLGFQNPSLQNLGLCNLFVYF